MHAGPPERTARSRNIPTDYETKNGGRVMARNAEDISTSIKNDFFGFTGKSYRDGSAVGFFTEAVARSMEDAYNEIERAKNPHIYTNLSGDNLDKMGTFVNVPRETDESDADYLYRIMNWTYLKAGANLTAVNDSLLNLTYASNAEYYPGIHGAGTGVVYVIPKDYSDDTIANALAETKSRIKNVISPESYTEYIVPTPLPVVLVCHLETDAGDLEYLKSLLSDKIEDYVNAIAPNDALSIGEINKMAMALDNVDFFSVDGVYVNDVFYSDSKIVQELETKFLFQEITWRD